MKNSAMIRMMILGGEFKELFGIGLNRLYSNRTDLVLRRDLSIRVVTPVAKIPIHVRELQAQDIPTLIKSVPERFPAFKAGLKTCYVAVTEDGQICYMQWLINPSENHLRPRKVGLLLQPDEVLLEWAFTFEQFRGLGIMAAAMAKICERAAEAGARWAITLVEQNNVASLKGCKNVGFSPYQLRREIWRGLRIRQVYEPVLTFGYPFELDK
jgi:hypothetical protein